MSLEIFHLVLKIILTVPLSPGWEEQNSSVALIWASVFS